MVYRCFGKHRKAFTFFMAAMLFCAILCACGNTSSKYEGKWVVNELYSEEDDMTIPADQANIVMEITFKSDGTYSQVIGSYSGDGEWEAVDDGVSVDTPDGTVVYKLNDDGALEFEFDGLIAYYEKM